MKTNIELLLRGSLYFDPKHGPTEDDKPDNADDAHIIVENVIATIPFLQAKLEAIHSPLPLPLLEKGVAEKTRKERFESTMGMLLTHLEIKHINKIDLVFIPIIHNEHVFIFVFDMKNPAFEVIDNMATGAIKLERYSHIPATMRDVFSSCLLTQDHPNALKIYYLTLILVDMPWKITNNGVDCGIFFMRHMETYMGGGVKKWKTGLLQESEAQNKQLNQLRFKYLCKILLSNVNFLKEDVLVQAIEHDSLATNKKQWPKTVLNQIKSRQRTHL
ncbi:hypothetical protein R6Q59_035679 [Mikania micrantha]